MGRILFNSRSKSLKKRRVDEEEDLLDELSRRLNEFDGNSKYNSVLDSDYTEEEYDDISDNEDFDDEDLDSEYYDEDDEDLEEEILHNKQLTVDLPNVLRTEIKKQEPFRDYLLFKYKGEICEGVPLAEINPNKFIFKIDGKMRSIVLSEIKIL